MNCFGAVIELPTAWPDPPSPMSFSTLRDIEACPRKWGLRNATYSQFEGLKGYPTKLSVAAIRGLVVHRALEEIVKRSACRVAEDLRGRIIKVLREGGGLSQIVGECAGAVLNRYTENPRAEHLCAAIRRQPEFYGQVRAAVQKMLQGLSALSVTVGKNGSSRHAEPTLASRLMRRGISAEVTLEGPSDWFGKADLIVASGDSIRIEDFKSGTPKEDDALQLKIYAWLFWRDAKRNPSARVPNALFLRYLGACAEVPAPSLQELKQLERDILERTAVVREQIKRGDFPARVSDDNCSYCPVRQMCEPYWNEYTPASSSKFFDVEVEVLKLLSPRTWSVRVQRGCEELESNNALLVGPIPEFEVSVGDIARAISARISVPDDNVLDNEATISLSLSSEMFLVR